MAITKERETTEVRQREELRLPKAPPIEAKVPPVEEQIRQIAPHIGPVRGPRQVRWLPWMAGLVVLVALTSVLAVVLTSGDEVAESPELGTELTTPSLGDINLNDNPEALRANPAIVTTPSLSDINLNDNPEALRANPARN